jgi:NAD(P)-dependent dehydrogenase (short-subunit alcohol dehydrogenase family)
MLGGADIAGGRRWDAQRCFQGCAPEGLAIKYRLKYLYATNTRRRYRLPFRVRSIVEHIKEEETEQGPLGRRGTPEEVAAWIVDLANPKASWMTGQVIAIDGGLSIA